LNVLANKTFSIGKYNAYYNPALLLKSQSFSP